jgi:hypothetical protein
MKHKVTVAQFANHSQNIAWFVMAVTMVANLANFARRMAPVGSNHQIPGISTMNRRFHAPPQKFGGNLGKV